jgi:hypothetical protein
MKNPLVWIIVIALAALAAWYFTVRQDQAELAQTEVIPAVEPPAPAPEPERYPVEDIAPPMPEPEEEEAMAPPPEPLPALEESDEEVRAEVGELPGAQGLDELLVAEFLLGRIVSTVDALDTRRVAPPARPMQPVPGRFQVLESDDRTVMSPKNAERYTPYVQLIANVETDDLVALYLRYYPLLQEAYLAQGHQDAHFNDRMVDILDLLLTTPEPRGLIEVVQNEAVYEFADPALESLTVGQKALLRLSEEDRRIVKQKLRALRDALAGAGAGLRGASD